MTATAITARRAEVRASSVFAALLRRDMRVARRELPFFLLRTTMQPLMFVIVFGYLMPKMGFMGRDYTTALLPGVLAISLAFSSIQSVEDRLLAPVPIWLVPAEKIVAGVLQGMVSALFVLPVARLIMGPIPNLTFGHFGDVLLITVLGAAAFSAAGLFLGTAIQPQQIGLMFGVIVAPMIFFGCAYYPWQGLSAVPVMKYAVLINPLVYVAEGMRAALTPAAPHMSLGIVIAALIVITAIFWTLGMRSFMRRAVG